MNKVNSIRSKIELSLNRCVDEFVNESRLWEVVPEVKRQVKKYSLCGGKRIRPVLFTLSFLEQGGADDSDIYTAAASLEILHLFALLQDDIIDNTNIRRGKPALHSSIRSAIENISHSTAKNITFVLSDMLFSKAIKVFVNTDFESKMKQIALSTIIDTAVQTGAGQIIELFHTLKKLDMISCDDILEMYDLKTADYTFIGPLCSGAQLAGAPAKLIPVYQKVGKLLGRAYQIYDDIQDCNSIMDGTIPADFKEGRKTILFWHLYNNGSSQAKAALENLQNTCSYDICVEIRNMMEEFGTFDYYFEEINKMHHEALALLEGVLPRNSEHILTDFLKSLFTKNANGI